jgi:hypothetical protein
MASQERLDLVAGGMGMLLSTEFVGGNKSQRTNFQIWLSGRIRARCHKFGAGGSGEKDRRAHQVGDGKEMLVTLAAFTDGRWSTSPGRAGQEPWRPLIFATFPIQSVATRDMTRTGSASDVPVQELPELLSTWKKQLDWRPYDLLHMYIVRHWRSVDAKQPCRSWRGRGRGIWGLRCHVMFQMILLFNPNISYWP